ncbi:MAG: thioredoxin domain-containing protein [Thermodesulfovibrionia bacterium]|nr:thioredoxin domain-containing protein [Thermodesulfovibrionia bacterium]
MKRWKSFVVSALLLVPLLFTVACADEARLKKIEDEQASILNRLAAIEETQKKILGAMQPQRPQVDYNKVYNLPIGASSVKGDKGGAVTIVEFSDFQCPYCSKLQPTLNEVLQAYPKGVKFVFKDFPLSFHKQAKNAAVAARAAGEQGKFWEMHDLLFENFNKLTDDSYKEFAAKLGLDGNKFMADFSSNKYDQLIQQDIDLAGTADVNGTPTLFINGKRMQGRSMDDFKAAIDGILKK